MAGESPAAVIVDGVNGVEVAVERGIAVPALARALLVAGIDGAGLAQALALDASGALSVAQPATSNVSAVPQSVVSVTLLAANVARKGGIVFNDGTRPLLVKLGAAASTTDWSVRLLPGNAFELPFPVYTGQITGIWTGAGAGQARMTETS